MYLIPKFASKYSNKARSVRMCSKIGKIPLPVMADRAGITLLSLFISEAVQVRELFTGAKSSPFQSQLAESGKRSGFPSLRKPQ